MHEFIKVHIQDIGILPYLVTKFPGYINRAMMGITIHKD
jgi:hypothetical protein